jgi:hypothetical protein
MPLSRVADLPHMALDGKTPSEVAGINIRRENKWTKIIQNAAKNRHP